MPQPRQTAVSIYAAPMMLPTPVRLDLICGTPKGQMRTQVRQAVHLASSTMATRPPAVSVSRLSTRAARAAAAWAWIIVSVSSLG